MMKQPLTSVIVTTKNNHKTIEKCLSSIVQQTYPAIELIIVDNNSTDDTKQIAERHTKHIYNKGPERSAQRNFAVERATGKYIFIVDSDMELEPDVIEACVMKIQDDPRVTAVIIPEESFGEGFWAKCKALERSYYVGVDWIEYPRFMAKDTFLATGGYDETIEGAEDWEFTQRLRKRGPFGRVASFIHHNEGRLKLRTLIRKRLYYYGQGFTRESQGNRLSSGYRLILHFYALYFSKPWKIIRHPILWSGMITMRTAELSARVIGYARASTRRERVIVRS